MLELKIQVHLCCYPSIRLHKIGVETVALKTAIFFICVDKATNPANREVDWEYINAFCDQINKELEGPLISVRLIAHKIQSPQEREALYALTVSSL